MNYIRGFRSKRTEAAALGVSWSERGEGEEKFRNGDLWSRCHPAKFIVFAYKGK